MTGVAPRQDIILKMRPGRAQERQERFGGKKMESRMSRKQHRLKGRIK